MSITLKKEKWNEEHHLHKTNYIWCPLCLARKEGEDNPQKHLVPPQQDSSQTGLNYLKKGYRPEIAYKSAISKGEVIQK